MFVRINPPFIYSIWKARPMLVYAEHKINKHLFKFVISNTLNVNVNQEM